MLYIDKNQMEEIVSLNRVMDSIERAFEIYKSKEFQMPDRMHVDRKEGTVLYMPCFTEEVFGTKIVSSFADNINKGVASIQGTMILNKSETGEPLAIMDGAAITAYRTGAVGGVGIRHTTRENCSSVGLIGTGVQGFYQLLYACTARDIKDIYIYDLSKDRARDFKDKLKEKVNANIHIMSSSEELVINSDIIITATASLKPVIPDDKEILRNKHIIAIGSYKPNMREIPKAAYELLEEAYIDVEFATKETGDIITPIKEGWIKEDQVKVFGDFLSTLKNQPKENKTTLYKSVGMALFDLIVANEIYNTAIEKGLGKKLK